MSNATPWNSFRTMMLGTPVLALVGLAMITATNTAAQKPANHSLCDPSYCKYASNLAPQHHGTRKTNQTKPNQTKPNQTKPIKSNQAKHVRLMMMTMSQPQPRH